MANFFLKWKIQGYEKKLQTATRESFYQKEAVSLGPIIKVEKAYRAGAWSEAIEESYKILLRFHDMSNAYYYLGMALARVGEIPLAITHLKDAIASHKKAMDTFDDHFCDDFIMVCKENGRSADALAFFEDLATKDARGKKQLERLRFLGKL